MGYAVATNESFEGSSSVAVPVLNRRIAIASVSVFGPTGVIEPEIDRLVPLLTAASRQISKRLGAWASRSHPWNGQSTPGSDS